MLVRLFTNAYILPLTLNNIVLEKLYIQAIGDFLAKQIVDDFLF